MVLIKGYDKAVENDQKGRYQGVDISDSEDDSPAALQGGCNDNFDSISPLARFKNPTSTSKATISKNARGVHGTGARGLAQGGRSPRPKLTPREITDVINTEGADASGTLKDMRIVTTEQVQEGKARASQVEEARDGAGFAVRDGEGGWELGYDDYEWDEEKQVWHKHHHGRKHHHHKDAQE